MQFCLHFKHFFPTICVKYDSLVSLSLTDGLSVARLLFFLFLQVLLFNGPCPASEPSDAELIAETGFKELGPTRPGSSASSSLWLTSSIGFNIDDSVCTNKLQAHCWRISPQTSHHSCHGWITSYRLLGFKFKTMFLFSLYEMANMGEAQSHSV